MKGNDNEALQTMEKAVGKTEAIKDLEAIKLSVRADANKEKASLREIFKPTLKAVLLIGIVLAVLQQITGINSVFFYAPMIFEQSGIGTDASFSQAIYVGLTNLVFTVVAIGLIDKIGRKPLLIIGVSGIVISMFVLGSGFNSATYSLTKNSIENISGDFDKEKLLPLEGIQFDSDVAFKAALGQSLGETVAKQYESKILKNTIDLNATLILWAIIAFVASFAISIGPVMWVMFSELFPNRLRGIAISFVGLINSIISFLVQLVFPWELANLGTATTFFIYGFFAALGLIFILWKVPETKGKSLEELEQILVK